MNIKAIQIDDRDNVATLTNNSKKGDIVQVLNPSGVVFLELQLIEPIPYGHKISIKNLKVGDEIIKYGETIGIVNKNILKGSWIHTHNVGSARMPTSGKEEGIL